MYESIQMDLSMGKRSVTDSASVYITTILEKNFYL